MIFLFGIGYARPVPVNPNRFKNPKGGMALVAIAGPLSNLLMAFVFNFVYIALAANFNMTGFMGAVMYFFYFAAWVNITLAVFNLFPIPPLDGSKVLAALLPNRIYNKYMMYERYIMIALFVLLFTGVLDKPISIVSGFFMRLISYLPALIFMR